MLTKTEADQLRLLLAEYHAAWEDYVRAIAISSPTVPEAGAHVTALREKITQYIQKDLS